MHELHASLSLWYSSCMGRKQDVSPEVSIQPQVQGLFAVRTEVVHGLKALEVCAGYWRGYDFSGRRGKGETQDEE